MPEFKQYPGYGKWRLQKKYLDIYESQGGLCFYCHAERGMSHMTRDHFIPRSKGGTLRTNVVLCCSRCNGDKSSMTIYEFRAFLCKKVAKYLRKYKTLKHEELKHMQIEKIRRYRQAIGTCTKILKEGVYLPGSVCHLPKTAISDKKQ